jgi:hypothetical protein
MRLASVSGEYRNRSVDFMRVRRSICSQKSDYFVVLRHDCRGTDDGWCSPVCLLLLRSGTRLSKDRWGLVFSGFFCCVYKCTRQRQDCPNRTIAYCASTYSKRSRRTKVSFPNGPMTNMTIVKLGAAGKRKFCGCTENKYLTPGPRVHTPGCPRIDLITFDAGR